MIRRSAEAHAGTKGSHPRRWRRDDHRGDSRSCVASLVALVGLLSACAWPTSDGGSPCPPDELLASAFRSPTPPSTFQSAARPPFFRVESDRGASSLPLRDDPPRTARRAGASPRPFGTPCEESRDLRLRDRPGQGHRGARQHHRSQQRPPRARHAPPGSGELRKPASCSIDTHTATLTRDGLSGSHPLDDEALVPRAGSARIAGRADELHARPGRRPSGLRSRWDRGA